MKQTSNHKKFKEVLLSHSKSTEYISAIKEWKLIYTTEKENNCICGHHIIKNCVFQNKYNNLIITIGSTCVKKFFGLDYSDHFDIKNLMKKYSLKLLQYCLEEKIINQFEYNFLDNLPKFKKYSDKQRILFFKIHEKICLEIEFV